MNRNLKASRVIVCSTVIQVELKCSSVLFSVDDHLVYCISSKAEVRDTALV